MHSTSNQDYRNDDDCDNGNHAVVMWINININMIFVMGEYR